MATALTIAGTAVSLFSGMSQASAMEEQGRQQQAIAAMQAEQTALVAERNALTMRDQAVFKAEQLTTRAGQERASAQRAFLEQRRKTELAQSTARAVAGASGGGVGDPTVLNIQGGLAQEGAFAEDVALFEGESAASLLTSQAALALYEGETSAAMTEFGGAQEADLLRYQGDVARYSADISARSTRMSSIGKAASSVGGILMSKYAPGGTTTGGTYNSPAQNYSGQNVGTYRKY